MKSIGTKQKRPLSPTATSRREQTAPWPVHLGLKNCLLNYSRGIVKDCQKLPCIFLPLCKSSDYAIVDNHRRYLWKKQISLHFLSINWTKTRAAASGAVNFHLRWVFICFCPAGAQQLFPDGGGERHRRTDNRQASTSSSSSDSYFGCQWQYTYSGKEIGNLVLQ